MGLWLMMMSCVTSLTVVVLLTTQGVCGDEWSIKYRPEGTCAFVGDSVNMSCSYTYPSYLTITEVYWTKHIDQYKNPPRLRDDPEYSNRISEDCEQGTKRCNLRIKSLTTLDIGEHYCRITTNYVGQNWIGRPGIYLNVKDAPQTSVSINRHGNIQEGTGVTLTCTSTFDLPVRRYSWYKIGRRGALGTGNTYTIKHIRPEDSGHYYCLAKYECGVYPSPAVHLQVLSGEQSPAMTAVITVSVCGVLGLFCGVFWLSKKCKKEMLAKGRNEQDAGDSVGNTQRENPNTIQISSAGHILNANTIQPDAYYQNLDPNTIQPDAVYQGLDPNTIQPDAVYQGLDPNTIQPDAVYQVLDPNTIQPDAVYQGLDPNTIEPDAVYQSLNPNTTQPDAVYQSLDPNTIQPDAVYPGLDPNTIQPDAVYQRLNPNTTQPDAVYQSLNPNTTQPDAVYQSLDPNTTQDDAVYQSLNPNTTQPDAVYQGLNPNTTQPDAVYQGLDPNTIQPDAVYQSLDPNTIQPDAVYPGLDPNTTQPDAVYQSLDPNTIQPDAVYQGLNPNTTQPDAVYQSLNPNTT